MLHVNRFVLMGATLVLLAAPALPQTTNIYLQHNLVADQAGMADYTDPGMVNPWGIAISGTSPFWLSDAGSGLSTVYSSSGKPATLIVTVPPVRRNGARQTLGNRLLRIVDVRVSDGKERQLHLRDARWDYLGLGLFSQSLTGCHQGG